MNLRRLAVLVSFVGVCAALFIPASARETFAPAELQERAVRRRAVEATIWGMPAVNFELMYQAFVQAKGDFNQIAYWSRLPDWKNQTLTPNPDVIYIMPFYNTKDVGPMVLEIPPAEGGSLTGSVDDGWQVAIEDIGPAGVDKGKGGKYLITPPGFKGPVPAGYLPLPSPTYAGYALIRSNLRSGSDADVATALDYGKQIKFYPLSQAANPATKWVDVLDAVFDSTIPYTPRYFEVLNEFVQREPWLSRDRAMIDSLRTIGIEQGKPYQPDAATLELLQASVLEAHAFLDHRYDHLFEPFNAGHHWALPASPPVVEAMQSDFANPKTYPVDDRAVSYSIAFFSAKHLGAGQFYLMTTVDQAETSLDGNATYRLRVPANAPVKLYWSATVYDRATHALVRNQKWSSRASTTPGLQKNADGSVDVYFGAKAPAGQESNWVPTDPKGQFEVLVRFYGPEKPLFEKAWVLPDIEKVR